MLKRVLLFCIALGVAAVIHNRVCGEAPAEQSSQNAAQRVELAEGRLSLPVPAIWRRVEPRSRIISHEFSIPSANKGIDPGRMTIMSAGGTIEANIARWVGQFQTPDGRPIPDDTKKTSEMKIGEVNIHLVDLTGDYRDQPRGPFGPTELHPGYRMLAAIVPVEGQTTWFIKLYGPEPTVAAVKEAFEAMIAGMELQHP